MFMRTFAYKNISEIAGDFAKFMSHAEFRVGEIGSARRWVARVNIRANLHCRRGPELNRV
jgi:hypothetical protein